MKPEGSEPNVEQANEASNEPTPSYRHEDTQAPPPYTVPQSQLRWELLDIKSPAEKQEFHHMLLDFARGQTETQQDRLRHHAWAYANTMGEVRKKGYKLRSEVVNLGEVPGSYHEARRQLRERLKALQSQLPQHLTTENQSEVDWHSPLAVEYQRLEAAINELTSIDEYVVLGRAIDHFGAEPGAASTGGAPLRAKSLEPKMGESQTEFVARRKCELSVVAKMRLEKTLGLLVESDRMTEAERATHQKVVDDLLTWITAIPAAQFATSESGILQSIDQMEQDFLKPGS